MMERLSFFGNRPVPPLSGFGSVEFYKGLGGARLLAHRCSLCGQVAFPPTPVCWHCGAAACETIDLGAVGKLFSHTLVHAAPGALNRLAPYAIGLVDLEQGVRLLCRLFVPKGAPIVPGMLVRLFVADYDDGPLLAARSAEVPLGDIEYERSVAMPPTVEPIPGTYRAVVADKRDGQYVTAFQTLQMADLPDGDLLVRIEASGLNYKDALAITGRAPICKSFPMVLGVDLAGTVVESRTSKFAQGDEVIVTGYGMSETRWGGLSEYQSLPEGIVMRRPVEFSAIEAMLIGTAGYTAMLSVMALTDHGLHPGDGAVLITGATGGVGSVALSLLAKAGYRTIAVTGRPEQSNFLQSLGATDVVTRDELNVRGKGLARERWAGAIDVVGGQLLADVLAQTSYDGIVACCGMAGSGNLPAFVYPFILRGVTLKGIDSVMAPMARRIAAWTRLAAELDPALLRTLGEVRPFTEVMDLAAALLDGKLRGRIALDIMSPAATNSDLRETREPKLLKSRAI